MKVDFYRHPLGADDLAALTEALASPILTNGRIGERVERQIAEFLQIPHALLTNSWSNGAVTALRALGVGPGDEVIVPAMTFIATANVVEWVGARPVFVDVDADTLLMTPEAVAQALTPRTRAVIPVHLYGQMCDLPGIRQALDGRDDVALIEDAAHCFEGALQGRRPGALSDVAIFSFYATKNVTCGEGGAIVTRHAALAERMRRIRSQGMTQGAKDRFSGGGYNHWDMTELGLKSNLSDILAALLPAQIAAIETTRTQRQHLAQRYRDAFANGPLRMPHWLPQRDHAHHLFPVHAPADLRDAAIRALEEVGVSVTVNYRAAPLVTYYREKYGFTPEMFPVSHAWGEGVLSLPLYPALTAAEQAWVIDAARARLYPLLTSAAA
ncbi:DegT/DnrJ/EryC1/StrS family aminotransferase [Magnetofaba australis]|uniref:Putative DegT/DnrJ/EryC1/StrS aminotransferase n=1 Tax=Magnetofaba australis IT-1 TaxID=1434232 RepID=A0A1Y2K1L5_9PROT|nr:DegT/DnrJ/EryC1/StrS family aminotransferase [Magnetofaba australis]OSM01931.1 putative DegT/DnrJ/EryC1/StrS aminotransferase [Magnetofaba australis IT-1]